MNASARGTSEIARPGLPPGPYLVVGLARSGQAAAQLLAGRGHAVAGVDAGRPGGVETLGDFGVEVFVGSDGLALLEDAETVIKSPGVPREAAVIAAARAAGKPVIGEFELGWRLLPNRFIAVTGTNGKTTTTELLAAIYAAAGEPHATAGNVGRPLCAAAGALDPGATVIAEVSSFQLEDAPAFNPECAVLLNVTPDHLDRHGTFDAYAAAKLSMFARMGGEQWAVIGPSVELDVPGAAAQLRVDPGAPHGEIALRGAHNLENALAAAAAARAMGIDDAAIGRALADFAGVEHRLEDCGEIGGVAFVNDSKATNVAAARVALDSFDGGVHAILGGSLKGERFTGLRDAVASVCAGVYVIGEAAPALRADLDGAGVPVVLCETLATAVARAAEAARPGDTVLLSPACASFDHFANYAERGATFKRLVAELAVAGQR